MNAFTELSIVLLSGLLGKCARLHECGDCLLFTVFRYTFVVAVRAVNSVGSPYDNMVMKKLQLNSSDLIQHGSHLHYSSGAY